MNTTRAAAIAIFSFLFPAVCAAQFEAQGANLTVRSGDVEASFRGPDVVSLTNRLTGESYLKTGAGGTLSNLITAASSDELDAGVWTVTGAGEATLAASDGVRSLTVTVRVDPATQEIVVRVAGASAQAGVERLNWAVAGFDMDRGRFVAPAAGGVSLTRALLAKQPSQYFGVEDSGHHWDAPLALFQAAAGGVAIYSTDTAAQDKSLAVGADQGGTADALFEVAARAPWPTATEAGEVEWRIAAYRGGWQDGARIYRDWHQQAMPAAPLDASRAWAAKIRTVVQLYASPYDPAVLDDLAKRVDPSQTLLYLAGWRDEAFDANYPDYTPAASAQALADHAHALGFRIMLHVNMIGVAPGNADYQAVRAYQVRDEDGEQLLGWNWDLPASTPNRFAFIDPAAAGFRQLLLERVRGAIESLGADALHLHMAGWPANDGNGLIDGMNFAQGAAELHRELLAAFPGLVLAGEGTNDAIAPYQTFAQQTSWPDGFDADVAAPLPVTAYVFANVHPYGHLALPNPYEAGYLHFVPQYEAQAVLPTFSVGFTDADRPPYGNADMARLMGVVGAFQKFHLAPDWDQDWSGDVVRYAGDGATAALRDDGTYVTFTVTEPAQSTVLYQRVHGAARITSALHVPDWPAYNGAATIGLDPENQYWLGSAANNAALAHITGLPDGVRLATGPDTLVTPEFAYFKLRGETAAPFDFYDGLWQARTGVTYAGVDHALGDGATVRQEEIVAGGEARTAIAAQPPDQGPAGGETYFEYDVPVASGYSAVLTFAAGMQDAAASLHGAMTFRVVVNGTVAWQKDVGPGRWEAGSVDLTSFLGQTVRVRFVTGPGPSQDPAYAWGGWSALGLAIVEKPATADVALAVPSGTAVVAPSGASVAVNGGAAAIGDLPLGETALVFARAPQSIAVGQSLMDLAYTRSQASEGQLAGPSTIPYAGNIGPTSAGGVNKSRTIYGYSPSRGQLILSWPLRLPVASPLYLAFSAGLIDGATPARQGVLLEVRVNGEVLWQYTAKLPARWEYGSVDLSRWAGQNVLLELVSDSLGQNATHWTSWAELTLHGSAGSACATTLAPGGDIAAGADGAEGTIQVSAQVGCSWTATGASWVTVTPETGSGSGAVHYVVANNPGPARQATVSVAGHLLQVTQEASPPPQIAAGGVVNAASFAPEVAPGSLATVFGRHFAAGEFAPTGMPLPAWLGGLSVTVAGIPAPLTFAGPGQVNFQVPYEVAPGKADLVVAVRGVTSDAATVAVSAAAPGLFTYGAGRAVVQNEDYSVNTADNPAAVGSYVVAYITGGGTVDHSPGTGRAASAATLARFAASVKATIGGVDAPVSFAGLTPGFAGLGQVNIEVPDLAPGTYALVVTAEDIPANSGDISIFR